MTLQTENEQEQELGFDWKALAEQVARKVLETEKCPYESEISLTLTDNREIRRLNREFRGTGTRLRMCFPFHWSISEAPGTTGCWRRRKRTLSIRKAAN